MVTICRKIAESESAHDGAFAIVLVVTVRFATWVIVMTSGSTWINACSAFGRSAKMSLRPRQQAFSGAEYTQQFAPMQSDRLHDQGRAV